MLNYKFVWKKTPVRKTTKQSLAGLSVQFNVSGETISFCHKCHLVKNIASLNTAGITAGIHRCQLSSGKISCIVISVSFFHFAFFFVHCWIFICEIVKSKLVLRNIFTNSAFCFVVQRDDIKPLRKEVSFVFER